MPPRSVSHFHLGHLIAFRMCDDRNEAMQFAVQSHLLYDLGAKAFETAIVIVQPEPGHAAHHAIKNRAGPHFVPRILSPPLPAIYDVATSGKFNEKIRNLRWIIL